MRVLHTTQMQFSQDPGAPTVPVRFYYVPNRTPLFPWDNAFAGQSYWEPEREWWATLGEQYKTQKIKGQKQGPVAGRGQLPCGTPSQWIFGVDYPWPRRGVYVVGGYYAYVCCYQSESSSSGSASIAASRSGPGPSRGSSMSFSSPSSFSSSSSPSSSGSRLPSSAGSSASGKSFSGSGSGSQASGSQSSVSQASLPSLSVASGYSSQSSASKGSSSGSGGSGSSGSGSGGGTVKVPCCPQPMHTTLYVSITSASGTCSGLNGTQTPVFWSPPLQEWVGNTTGLTPNFNFTVQCAFGQFFLIIDGAWRISLSGTCGPMTDLRGSGFNGSVYPCNGSVTADVTS